MIVFVYTNLSNNYRIVIILIKYDGKIKSNVYELFDFQNSTLGRLIRSKNRTKPSQNVVALSSIATTRSPQSPAHFQLDPIVWNQTFQLSPTPFTNRQNLNTPIAEFPNRQNLNTPIAGFPNNPSDTPTRHESSTS